MSGNTLASNIQDAQALAEAYVILINRLPGFEDEVSDFFELNDGHIFSRLLREMDSVSFKLIEKISDTNWIPKITNLRKLHSFMDFYVQRNQKKVNNFKPLAIDFHIIARKQDIRELVRLCQQVFYILFFFSDQCPSLNLGAITSGLPRSYQDLIARATNELTPHSNPVASPPPSQKVETSNSQLKKQLDDIKEEYEIEIEKLKKDHDRIFEELQFNKANLEESQVDKKNLQQKINDYEANLVRAGDFSKTEMYLKQEIDELRNSLSDAEQKRHEAEIIISHQNADLSEQSRQVQSLHEKLEQLDQLKDKDRELRQTTDRLQRAENMIEKYKKRVDDLSDLNKRFKASEEQNFKLVEKNSQLEEEIQKLSSFKAMNENYKEQILSLESKSNTLNLECERSQFEIRNLKENIRILEIERDRYQEEAMSFESKLNDIELAQVGSDEPNMATEGMTIDEIQTSELKSKIIKLEQELSALRNANKESGPTQRIIILENMLEDSKKSRNKVEEELMTSHRKNLALEDELRSFQSAQSGDKMSYDLSLNLRVRLSEAEEQASQLKRKLAETEIVYDQTKNELLIAKTDLSMVGKDQLEAIELSKQEAAKLTDKFKEDNQAIQEKCQQLEEDARKQIQLVNQLLMDKDSLRAQSLQQKDMLLENERTISQLKTTLATLESQGPGGASADELSRVKEMLVKETNRNMELREENVKLKGLEDNLNLKISLLTEQLKSYEKMLTERSSSNGQEMFGEALSSLKTELKVKDEEIEKLRDQLSDNQRQHRREAAFMTSAWHDLGLRVIRDTSSTLGSVPNSRQATSSWLALQRNNLNVQLKRR